MKIFTYRNGQQLGPFSIDEINAQIASKALLLSDLVWVEGWPMWKQASALPGAACRTQPPPLPGLGQEPPISRRIILEVIGYLIVLTAITIIVSSVGWRIRNHEHGWIENIVAPLGSLAFIGLIAALCYPPLFARIFGKRSTRRHLSYFFVGIMVVVTALILSSQSDSERASIEREIAEKTQRDQAAAAERTQRGVAAAGERTRQKKKEFSFGWSGPKATIEDGVARLEFTYDQPHTLFNYDTRIDLDQYRKGGSIFKGQPGAEGNDGSISYEINEHSEELCKAVHKIAMKRSDVRQVTIQISCEFREITYEDRYGKSHTIPAETFNCGNIVVSDLDEVRKYTEPAYIREARPSFDRQLVEMLHDTREIPK
jgi:hypothetical protein